MSQGGKDGGNIRVGNYTEIIQQGRLVKHIFICNMIRRKAHMYVLLTTEYGYLFSLLAEYTHVLCFERSMLA